MAFRHTDIKRFELIATFEDESNSVMEFDSTETVEVFSIDKHIAAFERLMNKRVVHLEMQLVTNRDKANND